MNISIVGGSGYAGGELLRILLDHPHVTIAQVTSEKFAGQPVSRIHPNLRQKTTAIFTPISQLKKCDLLFLALPNTVSMGYMQQCMSLAPKIIDLGADFRLNSSDEFKNWYGTDHGLPEYVGKFVYGIAEIHRQDIKKARYVACGGCEATVSILALYPLVQAGVLQNTIIIDAKMSSSQSGGTPSHASHHPERAGAVRSYMPTGHRHTAEIRQELGFAGEIAISATAIDMVRGLLVTIHTVPTDGLTEKDVWKAYRACYQHEPFIRIVKESQGIYRYPEPKILQGSNYCDIGFALDDRANRLVVIAAIDNLVKGTAGQAVQAMNLMCGIEETCGLTFSGLHPI